MVARSSRDLWLDLEKTLNSLKEWHWQLSGGALRRLTIIPPRISVKKYSWPCPQRLQYKDFWKLHGEWFSIYRCGDRTISIRLSSLRFSHRCRVTWYICRLCSVPWQYHKTHGEDYLEARIGRARKEAIVRYVYTNPIPPSRMELSARV